MESLVIFSLDLGFRNIGWAVNKPFEFGYFRNKGDKPYENFYRFLNQSYETYRFNFVALESFRHFKAASFTHLTSEISGIVKLFCNLHSIDYIEVPPAAHKRKKIDFFHKNPHIRDAVSVLYYVIDKLNGKG